VKDFGFDMEDAFHLSAGSRIGPFRKDHAVIKENGFDAVFG
jgi:hypothetical protein